MSQQQQQQQQGQKQYNNINAEVRETILDILKDSPKCQKKDIQLQDTFEDLGFSSLDTVEMIVAFEENMNIEINEDEAENQIRSIGDAMVIFSRRYEEKEKVKKEEQKEE